MHTKLLLLSMLNEMGHTQNQKLDMLLKLLSKAVQRYEPSEIDWHLINGLCDFDILYLIAATDVEISICYNSDAIASAIGYVRGSQTRNQRAMYH